MHDYDIDFPVSDSWADFYRDRGLSVDPMLVVSSPRRKQEQGETDRLIRFLVEQNESLMESLDKVLKELRKVNNSTRERKEKGVERWNEFY